MRVRGLDRAAASRLSRHAALPIIVAAAVLKGARLGHRGLPRGLEAPFAAGAAAAFASTLASTRLLRRVERMRSYVPFAAYRVALGLVALTLGRRTGRRDGRAA